MREQLAESIDRFETEGAEIFRRFRPPYPGVSALGSFASRE